MQDKSNLNNDYLLTDLERYSVDNHLNQDQEIRRDKVVVNKDKKFESPKVKINQVRFSPPSPSVILTGTNVIFVIRAFIFGSIKS